jgi:hypothetical protein
MNVPDFSLRAATVADGLIGQSDDVLGPEDRDPLRTVIRIAFEVQSLLASPSIDETAREWTQETVCAGCESVLLARNVWRLVGQFEGVALPGPGADTFPANVKALSEQLDEALRTVEDESLPLGVRLRAVNRAARLQVVFLGATLW